jgi:hypothetical protein
MASLEDFSVKAENEENSKYRNIINRIVKDVSNIVEIEFDDDAEDYVALSDEKHLHDKYYIVVNRHSHIVELLRDVEFYKHKFKVAKSNLRADEVSRKYEVQINTVLNELAMCENTLYYEREKLDRVLRFYERAYARF